MSACCGRYLIIDFLIGTGKSIKFMLSVVKRRSMQVQVFFHNFDRTILFAQQNGLRHVHTTNRQQKWVQQQYAECSGLVIGLIE